MARAGGFSFIVHTPYKWPTGVKFNNHYIIDYTHVMFLHKNV